MIASVPVSGRGRRSDTTRMFALGMSNNGSGLALASSAMADHPNVLLTIVVSNLVQQLGAGFAEHVLARRTGKGDR